MQSQPRIDVFFVGVGKCGTSWLFGFLGATGALSVPSVKEPYLIDMDESRRRTAIARYYPAADTRLRADFSNVYYWDVDNPAKISAHNPDAKIVVTVRKPSERVVSHYRFLARNGLVDPAGIADYLKSDPHDIVARSDYRPVIDRYVNELGNSAVCVLPLELLRNDVEGYVSHLSSFLSVDLPMPTLQQQRPTLPAQAARSGLLNRQVHRIGMLVRRLGLLRLHAILKESSVIRRLLFTTAPEADSMMAIAQGNHRIRQLDSDYPKLLRDNGVGA